MAAHHKSLGKETRELFDDPPFFLNNLFDGNRPAKIDGEGFDRPEEETSQKRVTGEGLAVAPCCET